jgi:hypothetical protein
MESTDWFTEKNYNKIKNENLSLMYKVGIVKSSCLFPLWLKDKLIRKYIKRIKTNTLYFENLYNFLFVFRMPFSDTKVVPDYEFRTQLNEDYVFFNRVVTEYSLIEPILSQSSISISMFNPATYENSQNESQYGVQQINYTV